MSGRFTAHGAGYTVVLHVLLIPEELAVQRVKYRVRAGGHPVPENKIRERYHRLWALVVDGIARADTAAVYNNGARKGPRIVAQTRAGYIVGALELRHGHHSPFNPAGA